MKLFSSLGGVAFFGFCIVILLRAFVMSIREFDHLMDSAVITAVEKDIFSSLQSK